MKVVFLGTNGWYDTHAGNTICIYIQAGDRHILLDAGNGMYKADQHIKDDHEVSLFLSHFHLDHTEGLHTLNKFRFKGGLKIYGQPGSREILGRILAEPFTVPLDRLPFKAEILELSEGRHELPFVVETRQLLHASSCFGYRFEMDDKILAYIPDTGVCDNARLLAKDADLMIAESALLPGQEDPSWPHLNPESAAGIAQEAGARRLALVHFDAFNYPTVDDRFKAVEDIGYPELMVGVDGMQIEVE